jgi:hypothetical protein
MADKIKKDLHLDPEIPETEDVYVEWGENKQERIVERCPRSKSSRHRCKGPQCVDAFKKL